VAMLAWLEPDNSGSEGRRFVRHEGDLTIERASLESAAKRPEFWLSGFVTNRGPYPWRVREIEVRFLNSDGSLLDVQHPRIGDPFVVQSARECAFRLALGRLPPAVSGTGFQARVQHATDGTLARDPD
jgi:hypothetical protein